MVSQGKRYGFPPAVPGLMTGEQILQPPAGSPYNLFTFTRAGRIWAASCSASIGTSAAAGTNNAYARVRIQGLATLAICEVVVANGPDADSNEESNAFPGLGVAAGAVIQLDVNGGASITGCVIRASGLVVVSVP